MSARTGPLPRESAKRRRQRPARRRCVAIVMDRDRTCRYPGCTRPPTDAHEMQRGQMRAMTWLDPEKVIGLCHEHHALVTDNPQHGHDLGLVMWSWEQPTAQRPEVDPRSRVEAIHAAAPGKAGRPAQAQPRGDLAASA